LFHLRAGQYKRLSAISSVESKGQGIHGLIVINNRETRSKVRLRLQVQEIAGMLNAELKTNSTEYGDTHLSGKLISKAIG